MLTDTKRIEKTIRDCLPETMTFAEKCQLLDKLADEYRKKSRKEVYDDIKKIRSADKV